MPSLDLHTKPSRSDPKTLNYYAVFYDPDRRPKRIWRTLRTTDKRIARTKLAGIERQMASGEFDPWTEKIRGGSVTLAEADEQYRESCERRDRPITRKAKKQRIGAFVHHFAPDYPLSAISPRDITDFLDGLTGHGGHPAMPNTVNGYWAALFGLFTWCTEQGFVKRHPMKDLDAPTIPESDFHVFTPAEMVALEAAILGDCTGRRRHRAWFADVVQFAVCSGLRLQEVTSLRHSAVRDDGHQMSVTVRNFVRSGRLTKSGKVREVQVLPRGAEALRRIQQRARDLGKKSPDSRIILGAHGTPTHHSKIVEHSREYMDMIGLPGATFHDLRHTFISWCLNELGLGVAAVQAMAGHADANRTISYQRVSGSTVQDLIHRALVVSGVERPAPRDRSYAAVARYVSGLSLDESDAHTSGAHSEKLAEAASASH